MDEGHQPFKLRLYFTVVRISEVFNVNQVEIKMKIDNDTSPYPGEFFVRVPAWEAHHFIIGDYYTARMTRIE